MPIKVDVMYNFIQMYKTTSFGCGQSSTALPVEQVTC